MANRCSFRTSGRHHLSTTREDRVQAQSTTRDGQGRMEHAAQHGRNRTQGTTHHARRGEMHRLRAQRATEENLRNSAIGYGPSAMPEPAWCSEQLGRPQPSNLHRSEKKHVRTNWRGGHRQGAECKPLPKFRPTTRRCRNDGTDTQ